MKCYYEILNVSRDADDAEIKSSYRRLALKWHPDKNLDDAENAKEQFQIVQQAYEVLSDRQERAWYDNHREQILRGSSSEFQDKSLDVFQYFTTTCFRGYGDDENGFYTVYRCVFEKIAQEDMEFMEDKDEFCEIPSFGNSQTDYEKVSEFYAHWLNYSTKKSYVWLDPHNIRDIRDRRFLKLVEKENKKVRQNAKKERNEELRSLVAFVKKRDKRVHAHKKMQFSKKSWTNGLLEMSKKKNYPSADRNKTPILEVLQKHFDKNIEGKVLEISSGTGQHLAYFAPNFPKLTFQPTEFETSLFDSINAYADEVSTKNVRKALLVSVTDSFTKWGVGNDFDYAININMIHVTPFSCSIGLFKNVSQVIKPNGLLFTYGPYANNGVLEPQSNRDFDRNIRIKDPNCGVRDIQDLIRIAEPHGIKLMYIYDLPANNKCLVWEKLLNV